MPRAQHHSLLFKQVGILFPCVLAENEVSRFNEIGKAIPDIFPKVLAEILKNLESDVLISRKLYAEIPPRVEYSLTNLCNSLTPFLYNRID